MSLRRKLIEHYSDQFIEFGGSQGDSDRLAEDLVRIIEYTIATSNSNNVQDSTRQEEEEVYENSGSPQDIENRT